MKKFKEHEEKWLRLPPVSPLEICVKKNLDEYFQFFTRAGFSINKLDTISGRHMLEEAFACRNWELARKIIAEKLVYSCKVLPEGNKFEQYMHAEDRASFADWTILNSLATICHEFSPIKGTDNMTKEQLDKAFKRFEESKLAFDECLDLLLEEGHRRVRPCRLRRRHRRQEGVPLHRLRQNRASGSVATADHLLHGALREKRAAQIYARGLEQLAGLLRLR